MMIVDFITYLCFFFFTDSRFALCFSHAKQETEEVVQLQEGEENASFAAFQAENKKN